MLPSNPSVGYALFFFWARWDRPLVTLSRDQNRWPLASGRTTNMTLIRPILAGKFEACSVSRRFCPWWTASRQQNPAQFTCFKGVVKNEMRLVERTNAALLKNGRRSCAIPAEAAFWHDMPLSRKTWRQWSGRRPGPFFWAWQLDVTRPYGNCRMQIRSTAAIHLNWLRIAKQV